MFIFSKRIFFHQRTLHALIAAMSLQSNLVFAEEDDYINPDRPGIADGSKVVGAGRFQIETGIQSENHRNGSESERRLFIPTLLRLGLSKKWEARIETNAYTGKKVSAPGGDEGWSKGFQPISLGLKYQFFSADDNVPYTTGAIFRIFPASGSGEFRSRHTTGDIRLVADWDFSPNWSINPNVGIAVYEDEKNQLFTAALFAATISYNATDKLNFFVDTGMQSKERKDGGSAVIFDAGVAYLFSRDVQIDFSFGTGAVGSTTPRNFLSVGVAKRF